jgi:Putative phage replication protein RstA
MKWHENFKVKRQEYDIKQIDVAHLTGITNRTLSMIENGKRECSESLKKRLDLSLEQLNPKYKLYAIYDYVRIRFPSHDHEKIIKDVLQMNFKFFIDESKRFYGYKKQFVFSDITIMISEEDDERGTLLELKGKGCRRMEYMLEAQQRTWNDFFITCLTFEGVFKRLDIAINDTSGVISIEELTQKAGTEECDTIFSKFQKIASFETLKSEISDGKVGEGKTLYIGSKSSEVYFCIYEKDYEQHIRKGIPIEDADVKNRFEIRLKGKRALVAINDLITNDDIEKTAFEIINRYVCFYDEDKSKEQKDWDINYRWAWFIGNGRGKLRLTMQPEPYSIYRTQNWASNQVAPTISLLDKIDRFDGTHLVNDIRKLKLPDKQKKIYEQYTASVYDVILTGDSVESKEEITFFDKGKATADLAHMEKINRELMRKLSQREEEVARLRKKMVLT